MALTFEESKKVILYSSPHSGVFESILNDTYVGPFYFRDFGRRSLVNLWLLTPGENEYKVEGICPWCDTGDLSHE